MEKVGWALIGLLAALQLVCAAALFEAAELVKRTASIDERTAMIRNEAALKALESERIREEYYRVLSANPFTLTEEEAKGIIRSGVRKGEK